MGSFWMVVSKDEYEWPIIVADSRKELAELCGVKATSISSDISKLKKKGGFCRYRHVKWDDKEDDE